MAARTFLEAMADQPDAGALHFLREHTPPDAVVQAAPEGRLTLPQLVQRQMGVADPENSHVRVFYPLDMEAMRRIFGRVQHAFSTDSSRLAQEDLRAAHVTHVLVGKVEQERYGALRQFDDPTRFELVYADDQAHVYRLREDP